MAYFIGIDAGGTKTSAILGTETHIVAFAPFPRTIKLSRVDEAEAASNLETLLKNLTLPVDVPLNEITRTCLGMAGSEIPGHADWARATLSNIVGGDILVCSDAEIALEAAFTGGPGALLISGTGSVVRARDSNGKRVRAGGLGPVVGDEGSGAWIGQQAVKRAMYDHDLQTVSPLLAAIMRQWECTVFSEVEAKANSLHAAAFSELVPVVCERAEAGDETARAILCDAGIELARLVTTALDRLGESNLPVAYTGSILEKIPAVRQAMIAALPGLDVREDAVDPLVGALWLARHA